MEWSEVNSKQLKLVSAAIGAGAVVAMGGLAVAMSNVSGAQPEPPPPGPVTTTPVTTGEISTETTAPPAPETSIATPEITTTPTSAEPG
jgi:hypothetical protein